MFFNRLIYSPKALHSFRECDKIVFAKFYSFTVVQYFHFSFQQKALFGIIAIPVEFRNFLFPNWFYLYLHFINLRRS